MSLKLYFIGTVSSADNTYSITRKTIVERMQEYGHVLDSHIVSDSVFFFEEEARIGGVNIYARDISWIDKADAAVAELTVPTSGGGAEAERCAMTGKPLLILQHESVRQSPFMQGMAERCPNVSFQTYSTPQQAYTKVEQFLTGIKTKPIEGKFIVLDGTDFCGKGTQHRMLVSYLLDHPQDKDNKLLSVIATREPHNTVYQVEIRRILREGMDPYEKARRLAELFVKDRKVHAATQILPGKAHGSIVVSDRYMYSTLAYQAAQGVPLDELIEMHQGLPTPDLTLFIDVPLEERLRRKAVATDRPIADIFDRHKEFQGKVGEQYLLLKSKLPDHNIVIVDGNRPAAEVHADISKHVDGIVFTAKNT
jgi:dTMP kinase